MRGLVVSAVLSVALLTTCSGIPFDEKTTAIKEIQNMYHEVETAAEMTLASAKKEKNIDKKGESELLKTLAVKINETKIQLDKDAKAVIKLAISGNANMTAIHCIKNVSAKGYVEIDKASNTLSEEVVAIRLKKIGKVDYAISCIEAIMAGLNELIEEAKTKIKNDGIIVGIKNEASKNCNHAESLLRDIELDLHDPVLSREYAKMRQEIEKSLKTMNDKLKTELKQCLPSKS